MVETTSTTNKYHHIPEPIEDPIGVFVHEAKKCPSWKPSGEVHRGHARFSPRRLPARRCARNPDIILGRRDCRDLETITPRASRPPRPDTSCSAPCTRTSAAKTIGTASSTCSRATGENRWSARLLSESLMGVEFRQTLLKKVGRRAHWRRHENHARHPGDPQPESARTKGRRRCIPRNPGPGSGVGHARPMDPVASPNLVAKAALVPTPRRGPAREKAKNPRTIFLIAGPPQPDPHGTPGEIRHGKPTKNSGRGEYGSPPRCWRGMVEKKAPTCFITAGLFAAMHQGARQACIPSMTFARLTAGKRRRANWC